MKRYFYIVAVVACLISATGGYVLGSYRNGTETSTAPEAMTPPAGVPKPNSDGTMTYTSSLFGFSVVYPAELGQVTDHDEGDGAHTVAFENADGIKAFQVYIRPYKDAVIPDEFFRQERPSGRMQDPLPVVIDGVTATIFYSSVDGVGDTRELWLIHDGYLYEITTFAELDSWLADIMKTWKFL